MNSRSQSLEELFRALLLISIAFNLVIVLYGAKRMDFDVFRNGARVVLAGKGDHLYEREVQDRFSVGQWIHGEGYFYHPAYEIPLFIPFAVLPYKIGFWLWSLLQCGLVAYSAFLIRSVSPRLRASGMPIIAAAFALYPMARMVWWGQDSGLLLLCFVMSFRAFIQKEDFVSGVWLGVALFKFQFAIPAMLFLSLRRRLSVFGGFVLAAGIALLISFLIVGPSGFADYLSLMGDHGIQEVYRMPNLRAFVEWVGGGRFVSVSLSAMLFGSLLSIRANRSVEFSVALLLALLVSYHSFAYDYVLLLIPVLAMMERAPDWRRSWQLAIFVSPFWVALDAYGALRAIAVLVLVMLVEAVKRGRLSGEGCAAGVASHA